MTSERRSGAETDPAEGLGTGGSGRPPAENGDISAEPDPDRRAEEPGSVATEFGDRAGTAPDDEIAHPSIQSGPLEVVQGGVRGGAEVGPAEQHGVHEQRVRLVQLDPPARQPGASGATSSYAGTTR